MPIVYCGPGDLLKASVKTIVIPVNTVGVMGSGFALWYKQQYPAQYERYRVACRNGTLKIGRLLEQTLPQGRSALLFPTKQDWRNDSELSFIEAGLERFSLMAELRHCESIAFPALGCGKGKLSFKDVEPLLKHYLDPLPFHIEVYSCRQQ